MSIKKSKNTITLIQFFKHKSVRFNQAFPWSCFKKIVNNKTVKIEFRVKGVKRSFVIYGREYQSFLNDPKIIGFLNTFRKMKSYKFRKVYTLTDIYNHRNIKRLNKKLDNKFLLNTYSSSMFDNWKEFINLRNKFKNKYKYFGYVDIDKFYDSLYTHFLKSVEVETLEKFNDYCEHYNNKLWLNNNTTCSVRDFFKSFEHHLNYQHQSDSLAIGNGLSDFVCELFSKMLDMYTYNHDKQFKKLKIIRFRDDIFIFGNDKKNIDNYFEQYSHVLNKCHLAINTTKKINARKCINFINKEQKDRDKFIKKFNKVDASVQFVKKYPQSNLIHYMLKQVYKNAKVDWLSKMVKIFNNSETNVIPWIVAIFDKCMSIEGTKQYYLNFIKGIKKAKLTESDKIWLWCFEEKHRFQSKIYQSLKSVVLEFKLNKLFNTKQINFKNDADVFVYSEW